MALDFLICEAILLGIAACFRQEKEHKLKQTQTFGSGSFPIGWGSSR